MITAQIIDRDNVIKKLESLTVEPFNEKNKIVQEGLRKSSRILLKVARINLKSRNKSKTGNLYRSMTYKLKRRKLGAIVGFKRGDLSMGGGNHAHLIDRGTKSRSYFKNGKSKSTGQVKGSNFFTDAEFATESKVYDTLYTTINDAINELMTRK